MYTKNTHSKKIVHLNHRNKITKKNRQNLIILLLFIVFILIISLISYTNKNNISIKDLFNLNTSSSSNSLDVVEDTTKVLYKIKTEPSVLKTVRVFGSLIVEASKNNLKFYNKHSQKIYDIPVNLNTPIIKISGSYMVIGDLNGTYIIVFNNNEKLWEKNFHNNITNFDIDSSGYLTLIHEQTLYKSAISVLNTQGMEVFSIGKVEHRIISAKLIDSSKHLILNYINTNGITPSTVLEKIDIINKKQIETKIITNEILPFIDFFNDSKYILSGSEKIYCFDTKFKELWNYTIIGNLYSLNKNSLEPELIFAENSKSTEGFFNKSDIQISKLLSNGSKKDLVTLNHKVHNISSTGNSIAINCGREVYFLNSSGSVLSKYSSKEFIDSVDFLNNSQAVLLSNDMIYFVKF